MKCSQYSPWLSRYLDDDLEGDDLGLLLEHLSLCAACRSELRDMEKMRFWLQEADAADRVSEEKLEHCFEGFLGRWGERPEEEAPGPDAAGKGRERVPMYSRLTSFLGLRQLSGVLRFASGLLVLVVLGLWFYPARESMNSVDVQDLAPIQSLASALPQEDEEHSQSMDLFIMQHATHQPWVDIGRELPMIQQVSATSR